MDLQSILAKLGLSNSGWAEDVQTKGVRSSDYGLSTATGITRARPEAAGGFEPGEATVEDVRNSLGDVFLSGLGMVPGGVLAKSAPTTAASVRLYRGEPRISRPPRADRRTGRFFTTELKHAREYAAAQPDAHVVSLEVPSLDAPGFIRGRVGQDTTEVFLPADVAARARKLID